VEISPEDLGDDAEGAVEGEVEHRQGEEVGGAGFLPFRQAKEPGHQQGQHQQLPCGLEQLDGVPAANGQQAGAGPAVAAALHEASDSTHGVTQRQGYGEKGQGSKRHQSSEPRGQQAGRHAAQHAAEPDPASLPELERGQTVPHGPAPPSGACLSRVAVGVSRTGDARRQHGLGGDAKQVKMAPLDYYEEQAGTDDASHHSPEDHVHHA